jgi:uncharacterized cupin superfamily protein
MEKISVEDVARWDHPMPDTPGPHRLGDALGASDVAVNYYDLAPGEGLSGGPHTHMDQEEVFYVLDGSVSFQVAEREEELPLGTGEAIRFAPGEVQHGYNDGEEAAYVLALGAPADSDDVRSPGPCPACGETVLLQVTVAEDGSGMTVDCPECGERTET